MSAKFTFGVIFDINDKDVTISASDLSSIAKNGVKFDLDEPIDLGTVGQIDTFIEQDLKITGVDVPSADNFPAPLNTIVNKLEQLDISIDRFKLDVPPKGQTGQTGTQYALQMSAKWQKNDGIDLGVATVKGGAFGVTNIASAPATASEES